MTDQSKGVMAAVERLWRRMLLVVGRGTITVGDDSGIIQRLQLVLGPLETRDGTLRLAEYGFTSMPLPGADAVIIFPGGDRSNGVIIATGDKRSRLAGLQPGEAAIYDDQGQVVYLTRTGIVIRGAGLPITVTGAPKVRFEMDMEVTGDVKDRCDTTGRTMAGERTIYNSHTHVAPGGGGVTSTPTPTE